MHALPPELWDRIIDYLYDDIKDLATCGRVCQGWIPTSSLHLKPAVLVVRADNPPKSRKKEPVTRSIRRSTRIEKPFHRQKPPNSMIQHVDLFANLPPMQFQNPVERLNNIFMELPLMPRAESLRINGLDWKFIGHAIWYVIHNALP